MLNSIVFDTLFQYVVLPLQNAHTNPALIGNNFLSTTASQLTYHGLCELNRVVAEGQLCVFFRNNHFSTMYKRKVGILSVIDWCECEHDTYYSIVKVITIMKLRLECQVITTCMYMVVLGGNQTLGRSKSCSVLKSLPWAFDFVLFEKSTIA